MLLNASAVSHQRAGTSPIAVHVVHEDQFNEWRAQQSVAVQQWLTVQQFRGERNKLVLLANAEGHVALAVMGAGKSTQVEPIGFWHGAALAERLPEATYQLIGERSQDDWHSIASGWLYGQYRFERYKKSAERKPRILCVPDAVNIAAIEAGHQALTLARDLINTPASDLSPQALADTAVQLANRHGGEVRRVTGAALLEEGLNCVHAVGRAATAAPELVDFQWGDPNHPRVTLVGKGVCFDSGGLDIKPPSGMLLMKKDMGGAACTLALAQMIMQAGLPVRLRVIIPAVENAIAGNAFRPGDVLKTRAGLSVEVGNTDAEGRLILCDALSLADEAAPDLLIDLATLTGAARVALGPELPALFTRDVQLAQTLMSIGEREADPVWHLPLWSGYDDELSSKIADLNNVSSSGFSGAIIGGLYLQRFVNRAKQWVHLDLYAWNGKDRPGRPSGAEPQTVRMLFAYLKQRFT